MATNPSQDPRWQKKRLQILERDRWACVQCGKAHRTLHVHHRYYIRDRARWNYPDRALITLCDQCHGMAHEDENRLSQVVINGLKRHLGWREIEKLAAYLHVMEAPAPGTRWASFQDFFDILADVFGSDLKPFMGKDLGFPDPEKDPETWGARVLIRNIQWGDVDGTPGPPHKRKGED